MIWAALEEIMPLRWWYTSAVILLLCGFIINFVQFIRLNRRMKQYLASSKTLQTFMSGRHLDSILQDCQDKIDQQDRDLNELDDRLARAEAKLRAGVDRAELMRFRAFEKEGSDLSFAFALLNQEGSGVVLSSINSRDEARVYAKPVENGESTYPLTNEERQVINLAREGNRV